MKTRCDIRLKFRLSATARRRLRYDVTIPRPGSFWYVEPCLSRTVPDGYGGCIELFYRNAL